MLFEVGQGDQSPADFEINSIKTNITNLIKALHYAFKEKSLKTSASIIFTV
jgi:hypothetical protein